MEETHSLIPMAICYDFDGTLAPGNMQEYGFFEKLGVVAQDFWRQSNESGKTQKADMILSYMKLMKEEAEKHHLPFGKEDLRSYATKVKLYPGVIDWFKRMNLYALEKGVALEHYIISSGLKEMVEGTVIAPYFKEVFASSFMYDEKGNAVWPGLVVNYTNKTQFLYRVNKGCLDVSDDDTLNRHMDDDEKPIPFTNMIYIGDGQTDIPSMKTVKREGGHTIAVFASDNEWQRNNVKQMLGIERADIIAPADYRENQPIDLFVKGVIDKIIADARLKKLQQTLTK